MKKYTKFVHLIIILVMITGIYQLVKYENSKQNLKILLSLESLITNQDSLLSKVAALTRTNNGDELTSRVVVDCTVDERKNFETLLDNRRVVQNIAVSEHHPFR